MEGVVCISGHWWMVSGHWWWSVVSRWAIGFGVTREVGFVVLIWRFI